MESTENATILERITPLIFRENEYALSHNYPFDEMARYLVYNKLKNLKFEPNTRIIVETNSELGYFTSYMEEIKDPNVSEIVLKRDDGYTVTKKYVNGLEVESTYVDNGELNRIEIYHYNEKGLITERIESSSGKLFNHTSITLYKYDNNGRLVTEEYYEGKGMELYKTYIEDKSNIRNCDYITRMLYFYDERGNLISKRHSEVTKGDFPGALILSEEFVYNDKNQLIKQITADSAGEIIWYDYEYDNLGHLVKITSNEGNHIYVYYNYNGKLALYSEEGEYNETYFYDKRNRLIERRAFMNGKFISIDIYEYDDNDNVVYHMQKYNNNELYDRYTYKDGKLVNVETNDYICEATIRLKKTN